MTYFGHECIKILCQSFPCLFSDLPLVLRGLTMYKWYSSCFFIHWLQLGSVSEVLWWENRAKARITPTSSNSSSTGSDFSFALQLLLPPSTSSYRQTSRLSPGPWGQLLPCVHGSYTLVTSSLSPGPLALMGFWNWFLVTSYSSFFPLEYLLN